MNFDTFYSLITLKPEQCELVKSFDFDAKPGTSEYCRITNFCCRVGIPLREVCDRQSLVRENPTFIVSRSTAVVESVSAFTRERLKECGYLPNFYSLITLKPEQCELVKSFDFDAKPGTSEHCRITKFCFKVGIPLREVCDRQSLVRENPTFIVPERISMFKKGVNIRNLFSWDGAFAEREQGRMNRRHLPLSKAKSDDYPSADAVLSSISRDFQELTKSANTMTATEVLERRKSLVCIRTEHNAEKPSRVDLEDEGRLWISASTLRGSREGGEMEVRSATTGDRDLLHLCTGGMGDPHPQCVRQRNSNTILPFGGYHQTISVNEEEPLHILFDCLKTVQSTNQLVSSLRCPFQLGLQQLNESVITFSGTVRANEITDERCLHWNTWCQKKTCRIHPACETLYSDHQEPCVERSDFCQSECLCPALNERDNVCSVRSFVWRCALATWQRYYPLSVLCNALTISSSDLDEPCVGQKRRRPWIAEIKHIRSLQETMNWYMRSNGCNSGITTREKIISAINEPSEIQWCNYPHWSDIPWLIRCDVLMTYPRLPSDDQFRLMKKLLDDYRLLAQQDIHEPEKNGYCEKKQKFEEWWWHSRAPVPLDVVLLILEEGSAPPMNIILHSTEPFSWCVSEKKSFQPISLSPNPLTFSESTCGNSRMWSDESCMSSSYTTCHRSAHGDFFRLRHLLEQHKRCGALRILFGGEAYRWAHDKYRNFLVKTECS